MLRVLPALALVALLAPTLPASAEPVVVERDELRALIEEAEAAAKRAEQELAKIPKAHQPREARVALKEVRGRLNALRTLTSKAAPPPAPAPAADAPRPCLASVQGDPIADAALDTLVSAVAGATFAKDKQKLLVDAARSELFTVAQVERLLAQITFGTDKALALRTLAPRLVDLTPAGRERLLAPFANARASLGSIAESAFAACQ